MGGASVEVTDSGMRVNLKKKERKKTTEKESCSGFGNGPQWPV